MVSACGATLLLSLGDWTRFGLLGPAFVYLRYPTARVASPRRVGPCAASLRGGDVGGKDVVARNALYGGPDRSGVELRAAPKNRKCHRSVFAYFSLRNASFPAGPATLAKDSRRNAPAKPSQSAVPAATLPDFLHW